MDKDTYRKTVQRQRRDRTVSKACVICGENDPRVLEIHHIHGRNNSEETIPLCKNHHTIITDEQNKIPPKARSKNASPQDKLGFRLVTIGSLLELSGIHLKNLGHEMINHD